MENEKMVKLKIESRTKGHEELELPLGEAVKRVSLETQNQGKWLYCDGDFVSADAVTGADLERLSRRLSQAQDITLASTLLGG